MADESPSKQLPDLVQLIQLTRLLTNASPKVNINTHSENIPGYSEYVNGVFDPQKRVIDIKELGGNPNKFLEVLTHELTHSESFSQKTPSSNTFRNDLAQSGAVAANNSLDRTLASDKLISKVVEDAKQLALPSSQGKDFEEARANAATHRMLTAAGKPGDPRVEKLLQQNPEFDQWISTGLGGKFIASPRMTESPPSVVDILTGMFRR